MNNVPDVSCGLRNGSDRQDADQLVYNGLLCSLGIVFYCGCLVADEEEIRWLN